MANRLRGIRQRGRRLVAVAVVLALSAALAVGASAQNPAGLPASVRDFPADVTTASYPAFNGKGKQLPDQTWRVVARTGNCCENYLGSDSNGRLYDFGGTYLNFSDDEGATWRTVRSIEPQVNGEGAVSMAPGGDVVGVGWDPYSGDHLTAWKYDAESEDWFYTETVLHTPFYDREWIAVIPGPFTIGPQTVPYITVIRGGWPSKGIWYYSLDGLNYTQGGFRALDQLAGGTVTDPIKVKANPLADWIQPNSATGIIPLPDGGALATEPDLFHVGEPTAIMTPPSIGWKSYRFPNEMGPGRVVADSLGRLHHLVMKEKLFEYSISPDGGKSWTSTEVPLPEGHLAEDFDFRANGALGIAAVTVHAHNKTRDTDQDLVYKLNIATDQAKVNRLYYLGGGDQDISSGLGADLRFDFSTIAILPSGKIAVSFIDGSHPDPVVAVQY